MNYIFWVTVFSAAVIPTLMLSISGSRIIIDNSTPKDPYVSAYCQLSSLCPYRGSHILCLTNPTGYGPACHSVNKNAIMRPDIAFRILALFNSMRSKIATRTEMWRSYVPDGSLDVHFPRGYGLWKLEWDSELATFAQIWANQCLLGQKDENPYDFCRSTKRFPFATQIVAQQHTMKAIDDASLAPLIVSMIRNIYTTAKNGASIDESVIKWCLKKCGDPKDWSYSYLQIIHGDNTHVGCGMSVARITNGQRHRLLLVCNFSHETRHFKPLYQLEIPATNSSVTYTQCGCPPKAIETPQCLCKLKKSRCLGSKCSPSVLVLPLVAFEEKPVTLQ